MVKGSKQCRQGGSGTLRAAPERVKWHRCFGKEKGRSSEKESEIELSDDPAIPLLGMYVQELKAGRSQSRSQRRHSQQPAGAGNPSVH